MDGLLLKLNNYQGNYPEPRFWNLFGSIRRDLDRFYWCFTLQPWMAPPLNFYDDTSVLLSYEDEGASEVQLWRPGGLSSYADQFSEEYIELWGIDPATGNPQQITAM